MCSGKNMADMSEDSRKKSTRTKKGTLSEGRRARCTVVFVCLAAAFLLLFILNMMTGTVAISAGQVWEVLTGRGPETETNIIMAIRLPRVIMAAILGGALALSGFLLQTFFENPIAGPFVLGISSSAKMAVAIVMILVIGRFGSVSSWVLILAAFAGAMLATSFIIMVSRVVRNMAALLVAGIMIGYICSAVTDFIVTFAADSDIINLHNWSLGSFSGMTWDNVAAASLITGICFAAAIFISKPVSAYQLGENYARSMGVNIGVFRVVLICLSSVLSATVTAFAGPISFVGIAVPFLMKSAVQTSKPLVVIPASFLGGAVFCMLCDLIARTALAPTELNISTVTSIFGAPVVIYMLVRRQKHRER